MPSRVIRGEINASDSLSRVSIGADLCFRALLVAVDDYGRLDARPALLKAALFPVRTSVNEAQVERWIDELASPLAGAPVRLYEVDGRPYLQLTNWETHRGKGRRAESSRYPDPPPTQPGTESLILGDPRKSEEVVGDPPVLRGTRDEGRGTCSEGDPREDPGIDAKRVTRALNILSKEPGEEASKRRFLEQRLQRIEDEAEASFADKTPAKRALNAKIRSLIVGWYRQELRNPGGPRPGGARGERGDGTDGRAEAQRAFERTQERIRQIKDTSPDGDTVGDLVGGIGRPIP